MSDVQFEGENEGLGGFTSRKILGQAVTPQMAKTFMKLGLVKNEKQAQFLMLSISALSLVIAIYIFTYNILGYNPIFYFQVASQSTANDTDK